jgi:hypothetical protein
MMPWCDPYNILVVLGIFSLFGVVTGLAVHASQSQSQRDEGP